MSYLGKKWQIDRQTSQKQYAPLNFFLSWGLQWDYNLTKNIYNRPWSLYKKKKE